MPSTRSDDRSGFSDPSETTANTSHRSAFAHPDGDLNDDDLPAEIATAAVPPLGAKLTCYRLLNLTTVILWAVPKAVLSYQNRNVAGTTVDLLAALCGLALYWFGLYEESRRGWIWEWFFKVDLAPAFGRSARRFVRGVVSVLSLLCSALVILPLIIVCLLSVIFLRLPRQEEFESIETVGGSILSWVLLVFYF